MIERPLYIKKIEALIDKPLIKVLTGVRRAGKSTLLKLLKQRLLNKGIVENRIIYINFESMKYDGLRTSEKLYSYINDIIKDDERYYILFDEIQLVYEWERAVNSFLVDFNSDMYITGSNSNLLSSELATLLTGRYIRINVYPLSYTEMRKFSSELVKNSTSSDLLWRYIRLGGFPAIHTSYYDESTAYMIINDVYDSIVLRDVVQRYRIRNVDLLNRIMKYIMDNVGNTFSAKNVADYFKSQYRKVDLNTVYNYIDALESSYIISRVNRYDVMGKEILKTQEKYYLADQGIQHAVFGFRDRNIPGILENIVYNELKRREYSVYIGKLKDKEIDFVAEKKNDKIYIQVTYRMDSIDTINREFGPLLELKDHYPKYVISLDENFKDNIEGIKHMHLQEFLLNTHI